MPVIKNQRDRIFSLNVRGFRVSIAPNGHLLVPQAICDNELFQEQLALGAIRDMSIEIPITSEPPSPPEDTPDEQPVEPESADESES